MCRHVYVYEYDYFMNVRMYFMTMYSSVRIRLVLNCTKYIRLIILLLLESSLTGTITKSKNVTPCTLAKWSQVNKCHKNGDPRSSSWGPKKRKKMKKKAEKVGTLTGREKITTMKKKAEKVGTLTGREKITTQTLPGISRVCVETDASLA